MLQKALVEAPNVDKQAAASRASVETPRGRWGARRPFPARAGNESLWRLAHFFVRYVRGLDVEKKLLLLHEDKTAQG